MRVPTANRASFERNGGLSGAAVSAWCRSELSSVTTLWHLRPMPKNPDPVAFLIAIRQPDDTDHVYAILARTTGEAIDVAATQEPQGPKPRHVGTLGSSSVKRLKLKAGEARII